MPKTPAELRMEAEQWLSDLGRHPRPLNRHLFLVPGITDEDGECWRWIDDRGRHLIPNWDAYVTNVSFADLGAPEKVLVDLGCASHNAMWEKAAHTLLFNASLEWLEKGTVNGAKTGVIKMGY